MECSCTISISYPDAERPAIFEEVMIKARKAHKCSECKRVIFSGERYERIGGLWDGQWDHFKICTDCLSVIEVFFTHRPCYGDLWEAFYNEFSYRNTIVPESCLSAVTPGARARICKMIEDNWWED